MKIFKNKNILIFGYERSGHAALSLLRKAGANVFIYDDKLTARIMHKNLSKFNSRYLLETNNDKKEHNNDNSKTSNKDNSKTDNKDNSKENKKCQLIEKDNDTMKKNEKILLETQNNQSENNEIRQENHHKNKNTLQEENEKTFLEIKNECRANKGLQIKDNRQTNQKSKMLFAEFLKENVCFLEDFHDFKKHNISFCVISPGVSLDNPKVETLKKEKVKIISELELGALFCKGKIFALTGTNGKTTSVHLLHKIFLNAKKKCFLCGNVGTPICEIAHLTTKDCLIVCEVSSFQLETTKNFKPFASAILNLQPDHLNRHKNMENYINIKNKINNYYKTKKIFNIDDKNTSKLSSKFNSAIQCSVIKKTNGCYLASDLKTNKENNSETIINDDMSNKIIMSNETSNTKMPNKTSNTTTSKISNVTVSNSSDKKNNSKKNYNIAKKFIYYKNQKIMSVDKVKLIGTKNLENILCTIALAKQAQIKNIYIKNAIENFNSLPNRLELVAEIDGIIFINDSKSTNVLSTLMALESVGDNVILLLGGSEKGLDFSPIFQKNKIKTTIVYGESQQKIVAVAENTDLIQATSFNNACFQAFKIAKKHDIVLLSPACASFDEFTSYEERGEQFKENIKKYYKIE